MFKKEERVEDEAVPHRFLYNPAMDVPHAPRRQDLTFSAAVGLEVISLDVQERGTCGG